MYVMQIKSLSHSTDEKFVIWNFGPATMSGMKNVRLWHQKIVGMYWFGVIQNIFYISIK